MDVERGSSGLRVFGYQLRVGETGDRGHGDPDCEGDPERPADFSGDGADEYVDSGPEHITQHIEEEKPPRD